jgi:glycosyltransferase involved in cell wall biosynthesis
VTRVVVLTETSGWGGTEVNTLGVIEALAAAGHEVTHLQIGHDVYRQVGPPPVGTYQTEAVPVAPYRNLRFPPLGWWLRLLRPLRPDVVVLSKGGFDLRSAALDVAARAVARRYVTLEHHPAALPPPRTSRRHLGGLVPGLALWWWRQYGLERVRGRAHVAAPHRVITDSRRVTDLLVRYYGLDLGKTFLVPWGVDPAVFAFRAEPRAELRARWAIPPAALVLGSVGRLEPVKAPERAVRAFAAVRRRLPALDAWLVLAGTGSQLEPVRALAVELGVADRVVTPGFVARAADALAALDVYVMPSREEGLGMALLEAMACERACVAMHSGGPADILTRPELGWLTPADDEPAFTDAVLAAVRRDAPDRAAMGRAARAHVERHFGFARQVGQVAELVATV